MIIQGDRKRQTKITNDWAALCPDMKKIKTRSIKRRVGPLSITLAFALPNLGFSYYPTFSVYNFSIKHDFLSAILYLDHNDMTHLGVEDTEHESKYRQIAEQYKKEVYMPIDGPITLDDIFNGYKRYHDENKYSRKNPHHVEGPALIAAWAGEYKKAKEYLEWADSIMAKEEPYILRLHGNESKKRIEILTERYNMYKAEEERYKNLKNTIKEPEKLRQIVREEVIRHKCQKVPYQNIVGVRYQE